MRTTTRISLAALIVCVAAALAAPASAQAIKIGVFDPARVSEEASDAQILQANLGAIRDRKQAELVSKEQVINDMRQRLQQQALSLSADKRTTMEVEIQRKVLELNGMKEFASQELQLEFAAAEARFNEKLRQVVEQFGRDQGFAVILDAGAVAWASAAVDVTTPIVTLFNRMYPAPAPAVGSGSAE